MYKILHNVRILDLCGEPAGSYTSKLFAEYGADVVKVEPPAGDPLRRWGPFPGDEPHPDRSGLFLYLNAGKRGVTLNLEQERGREVLKRLVEEADAMIESYTPGTMAAWGLGQEQLRAINPNLVVTSVSPFGQEGPYKDYKATDLIAWAMSGAMSGSGDPDKEPLLIGHGLSYYATGALAAVATLAALFRDDTRQAVDVSLVEGMIQLYGSPSVNRAVLAATGASDLSPRGFPRDPLLRPMPCKDGLVGINPLSPQHWPMFCAMAGLTDIVDDPRFITGISRAANKDALEERVRPWFQEHTKDEIFELALQYSLPAAFAMNAPEILAQEHHRGRGFFTEMQVPGHGAVTMPDAPVRLPEMTREAPPPAPRLGQHNSDVYGALGYGPADLERLRREGVI